MNTFGVSLFRQPQEFVAVYLGMRNYTDQFITYVQKLLHRTRSPPLAVTYTCYFLTHQTEQQLSLNVIRFVSQLADVSPGLSMSSSLHGMLMESAFLTELRHSLTHKAMVKGTILLLSRELILEELQEKYWKLSCEKLKSTYHLNPTLIKKYFKKIYNSECEDDLTWIINDHPLEFFQNCSNYEYKQHIVAVIEKFIHFKLSIHQFSQYFETVSDKKRIIFMVLLLKSHLKGNVVPEHFTHFAVKCVQNITVELFRNEFVQCELLKLYFLKYLTHARILYDSLPLGFRVQIDSIWREKELQIGKIY